jgi:cytosine/adenosine deaminase-related metal-dependent hydrolase
MIVRARVVLPILGPPLENGALELSRGGIRALTRWPAAALRRQQVIDLGESALFPGLINAHCHLDYTDMAGLIPPGRSFTDWIQSITTLKQSWEPAEFKRSWLRGADMLLRHGCTTVLDIEAVPALLKRLRRRTPLRIVSCLELIHVRGPREPKAVVDAAAALIRSLATRRRPLGLSPHAPYSASPKVLRLAAGVARREGWPLTIHAAESAEEYAMFTAAHGELYEWLKRNGRDMSDCGLGSPVEHLHRCGVLGRNLLLAHLNYLAPGDAARLGAHGVSVVHCPRSHAYFRHRRFPLSELAASGIGLCVGTDSLATVRQPPRSRVQLDLFAEMRALRDAHHGLCPESILQMVTINPARALGWSGLLGHLAPGTRADLVAIPFTGRTSRVYDSLLEHEGEVSHVMIDGRWEHGPLAPHSPKRHLSSR